MKKNILSALPIVILCLSSGIPAFASTGHSVSHSFSPVFQVKDGITTTTITDKNSLDVSRFVNSLLHDGQVALTYRTGKTNYHATGSKAKKQLSAMFGNEQLDGIIFEVSKSAFVQPLSKNLQNETSQNGEFHLDANYTNAKYTGEITINGVSARTGLKGGFLTRLLAEGIINYFDGKAIVYYNVVLNEKTPNPWLSVGAHQNAHTITHSTVGSSD